MVITTFPEEREILREELIELSLPKELEKEIAALSKLGIEDYELRYLLFLKTKNKQV